MPTRRALAGLAFLAATTFSGCCGPLAAPSAISALLGCSDLRANLTAEPAQVQAGGSVTLTGEARHNDNSPRTVDLETVAFDYDGDGLADGGLTENFVGQSTWARMVTYPRPGVFSPRFVVYSKGDDDSFQYLRGFPERAVAAASVTVNAPPGQNPPPQARLTGPDQAQAGQDVTLDASASTDDVRIDGYQWDFGNDGVIDWNTGSDPRVTLKYNQPGRFTARVIVTDNQGASGQATHDIRITEGGPSTPGGGMRVVVAAAAARPFTATLRGRGIGGKPQVRKRGTTTTLRLDAAGKVGARLSRPRRPRDRALRGLLGGTWRVHLRTVFDERTLLGRMDGIALARPAKGRKRAGRRQQGCLAFSVKIPVFAAPRGTMRLLGGTGRYSRLRVKASFTPTLSGAAMKLNGTVKAQRARARGLPRKCRSLTR
jgi:hypothetical protein